MHTSRIVASAASIAAALLLITPALADGPAPDPRVAQIETDFLTGMIPHHRSAVTMAQMALDRSTHPELKNMAQSIVDDQTTEIAQLTQWLHDWYAMDPLAGTSMPQAGMQTMMPMLHGRMPDMDVEMQNLQSTSAADFDMTFLSAMSHHHAMAIMMTGPVLMSGYHPELLRVAENVAVSQGQEVRQMGDWLQSWHGLQRPMVGPMMQMTTPMPANGPTSTPMPMDMGH